MSSCLYIRTYICTQVVLQIIKHCQEEGSSLDTVNGQLAGLVNNSTRTLEVTNCFPLYVPETENPEEASE